LRRVPGRDDLLQRGQRRADELGTAHELNDGVVPAELEDKARMAVANCPEYAIEITE
jgi:ferredoxin